MFTALFSRGRRYTPTHRLQLPGEQRHQTPEPGASAVEYALLLAGIAAVIVIAVVALGPVVNEIFTDTCDEFSSQASTVSTTC